MGLFYAVIRCVFQMSNNTSSTLDNLEEHLERSIENVRQIQIIVSDFQPQGQPGLNQKLQQIVKDLQEVEKVGKKSAGYSSPTRSF